VQPPQGENTVPGYLFVIAWPITELGGVNEVVKNLYTRMVSGNDFRPFILTGQWDAGKPETGPAGQFGTIAFRLRSPIDCKHPLKGALAYLLSLPSTLLHLRRLNRNFRIEVINPHFPGLNSLTFVVLRKLGWFRGKLILSFHGSDVRAIESTTGIARRAWEIILRNADAVVTCSQALSRRIGALVPSVSDKLQVSWNGVDPAGMSADCEQPYKGYEYVLSIGTLEPIKGHDILLDAFARVSTAVPGLHLVIIGRAGKTGNVLARLEEDPELSSVVHIVKDVPHEQIGCWMRAAKLFVLASRSEAFGLVILEAGACGVPVIATAVGGIPEIIDDGVHGRLIAPENPEALANAMVEVFGDPLKSRRYAENLRHKVLVEFTWDRVLNRYLQVAKQAG
jgi:glycosyltransferase involved in cell wall biosynthesis